MHALAEDIRGDYLVGAIGLDTSLLLDSRKLVCAIRGPCVRMYPELGAGRIRGEHFEQLRRSRCHESMLYDALVAGRSL